MGQGRNAIYLAQRRWKTRPLWIHCSWCGWSPPRTGAALVVNATPVGQSGEAAELPVDEALLDTAEVVCDLAYRGDGAETG